MRTLVIALLAWVASALVAAADYRTCPPGVRSVEAPDLPAHLRCLGPDPRAEQSYAVRGDAADIRELRSLRRELMDWPPPRPRE